MYYLHDCLPMCLELLKSRATVAWQASSAFYAVQRPNSSSVGHSRSMRRESASNQVGICTEILISCNKQFSAAGAAVLWSQFCCLEQLACLALLIALPVPQVLPTNSSHKIIVRDMAPRAPESNIWFWLSAVAIILLAWLIGPVLRTMLRGPPDALDAPTNFAADAAVATAAAAAAVAEGVDIASTSVVTSLPTIVGRAAAIVGVVYMAIDYLKLLVTSAALASGFLMGGSAIYCLRVALEAVLSLCLSQMHAVATAVGPHLRSCVLALRFPSMVALGVLAGVLAL